MPTNVEMLLNAEQHRRIAAAYRRPPEADWSAEERAKATELAGYHDALAKLADRRSEATDRRA